MARSNGYLINVRLLDLADDEFADLVEHPDHSEDVHQELALVEWAMQGTAPEDKEEAARLSLAWLAYELGVRLEKPEDPRPVFPPPDELTSGTFIRDLEEACVTDDRLAA